MDRSIVSNQKLSFEQDIMCYEGPDPLKPRYDYIIWLDSNFDKENSVATIMPVLLDTLELFKDDPRYSDDPRYVRLVIIYIERQLNPIELYETVYEQKIGTGCVIFYKSWADFLMKNDDLKAAKAVYKRAKSSNAQPADELSQYYIEFLEAIADKYFAVGIPNGNGMEGKTEANDNKQQICSVCKERQVGSNTVENNKNEDDIYIREWAFNPLKVSEPDDFTCRLVYFEPPDPTKRPMYAKNKVYRDDREYQFEELRAQLPKYAAKKLVETGIIVNGKELQQHVSGSSNLAAVKNNYANHKELADAPMTTLSCTTSARSQPMAIPSVALMKPPQLPPPQFPQLCKDSEQSLWCQSLTVNTKEALNVVQEMWNSPAPSATKYKANMQRSPAEELLGNFARDTNGAPDVENNPAGGAAKPRPISFPVFSDASTLEEAEKQVEKPAPSPFGIYTDADSFREPAPVAAKSTGKKKTPLPLSTKTPKERPPTIAATPAVASKQLVFDDENCAAPNQNHHWQYHDKPGQQQHIEPAPLPNPQQPIFPALCNNVRQDKGGDDLTDVTCNTKAFAFGLLSSTPFHAKSGVRKAENIADGSYMILANDNNGCAAASPPRNGGVGVAAATLPPPAPPSGANPAGPPRQDLSMILEASNEKYNSASSTASNGHTAPHSTHNNQHPTRDLENNLRNLLLDDGGDIDPFSVKLRDAILAGLKFPQGHNLGNCLVFTSCVPPLSKTVRLGEEVYTLNGELGRGNYARVVKANAGDRVAALKVEKPASIWEYYICQQIRTRVPPEKLCLFMEIKCAFIYQNGSILDTSWAKYGNLLDVINQVKLTTGKPLDGLAAMYFSGQVLDSVEYLHRANIIHADVKPDNFVLRELPNIDHPDRPCIQMIDFGRSIDMERLPADTRFTVAVTTDGFVCNEMKEKRPWTYQTDLYGLAGTVYCLLVGDYMKVVKKKTSWALQKVLPRYLNRETWDPFFESLLNVESCECLPSLHVLRMPITKSVKAAGNFRLSQAFKNLSHILHNK